MPALWVLPPELGTIDDEGVVRLSDGRTFDLSNVPGNGYNANRLKKINERILAETDTRVLLASLPVDDPDRTTDPNTTRMFWSDADGNPNPAGDWLTSRSVIITLSWDGNNLIPHCQTVR